MEAVGRFNDGETAASRSVAIVLTETALEITPQEGGEAVAQERWRWPLVELRRVGEERRAGPLILALAEEEDGTSLGDARLIIPDDGFRAALMAAAPQLKGARLRRRAIWRPAALTLAVALALVAFVLFGLRPVARAVAAVVPTSWEVAIGEAAYAQVLDYIALFEGGTPQVCVAAPGHGALAGLTGSLAAVEESGYDYRVVVLDHELVNAFALPGGRIVLFQGLIDFAAGPEEVAAVLSHEMAHIIARHGVARILEQFGLTILLDFVTGGGGVITGAGVVLGLSYSREDEREADRLGIELLNRAGLQSDGLASFFARFAEEYGGDDPFSGGLGTLLSTHPADWERIEAGRAAARDGRPALSAEEWSALRGICAETAPALSE